MLIGNYITNDAGLDSFASVGFIHFNFEFINVAK